MPQYRDDEPVAQFLEIDGQQASGFQPVMPEAHCPCVAHPDRLGKSVVVVDAGGRPADARSPGGIVKRHFGLCPIGSDP